MLTSSTASARAFILAGTVLAAAACSSRPIVGDGGDANQDRGNAGAAGGATAGAAGTGGAQGAAGSAGGSAGVGGASDGRGGTGGATGIGGATGTGGAAGTGGATGTGGAGGTGGATGTGGAGGGTGGTGGVGGTGGAGGRGGTGGRGGSAAPSPECATASDCKLVTDCCTCEAIPIGGSWAPCPALCVQSACDARKLRPAVACAAGRCVAGFACDTSRVTCPALPPTCPAGEVPVVDESGTCYAGTCAPASECTSVSGCGVCAQGDACASHETLRGVEHHCVPIPPECGTSSCSCLGAVSCRPLPACMEYSGLRGVYCSCPVC